MSFLIVHLVIHVASRLSPFSREVLDEIWIDQLQTLNALRIRHIGCQQILVLSNELICECL